MKNKTITFKINLLTWHLKPYKKWNVNSEWEKGFLCFTIILIKDLIPSKEKKNDANFSIVHSGGGKHWHNLRLTDNQVVRIVKIIEEK